MNGPTATDVHRAAERARQREVNTIVERLQVADAELVASGAHPRATDPLELHALAGLLHEVGLRAVAPVHVEHVAPLVSLQPWQRALLGVPDVVADTLLGVQAPDGTLVGDPPAGEHYVVETLGTRTCGCGTWTGAVDTLEQHVADRTDGLALRERIVDALAAQGHREHVNRASAQAVQRLCAADGYGWPCPDVRRSLERVGIRW